MLQAQGGDGQYADALVADEEGVFVRAVGRAAVLDDPEASGRELLGDAVVEDDHAVGDILFQAVPGERILPRSPVMIVVTPFSLSHRKRRRSSARRMASLGRLAKRTSIVSRTTRFALIESMALPSLMKSPSRSYSPVSSISLRSI